MCSLISALITIYLIFAAGNARIDLEHAGEARGNATLATKFEWIKFVLRVRDISSWAFVTIVFVHALLLFSPVAGYLPVFVLRGLSMFYGEYMPTVT